MVQVQLLKIIGQETIGVVLMEDMLNRVGLMMVDIMLDQMVFMSQTNGLAITI